MQAGGRRFDPVILHQTPHLSEMPNVSKKMLRFDLSEVIDCSFFNNLEEVKIYVDP